MPQSLSNILVHLVFSTKDRHSYLTPDIRTDLYPYVGGILRNLGVPLLQIGGVDDHVHLLLQLPRTMTVAQLVQEAKTSTSKWLKTKGPAFTNFSWQAGYAAFSVSPSDADAASRYIQTQEDHHRKVSFQDEFRALMREAGISIDEQYVWD